MPVLDNAQHEMFAQEIAKGKTGAQAYAAAGYESSANAAAVSANRLLKNAKIKARVDELLAQRQNMEIKATEKAIEKLALKDYREQFETNVFGVINTIQASLGALKASQGRLALPRSQDH